MTEVPKIVVDRLRAAPPAQEDTPLSHPDADLLTAFAERGLSTEERESVLAHLALCEDCRYVVTLALPPQESLAATGAAEVELVPAFPRTAKAERKWLSVIGWPSLRWAALAAGVIVGGALLLTRNAPTPIAHNSPLVAPVQAPPVPSTSAGRTPVSAPPAAATAAESHLAADSAQNQRQLATREPEAGLRSGSAKAGSGILIAQAPRDAIQANKPVPARPMALDSLAGKDESGGVSEAAVEERVAPFAGSGLMARNDAPAVEKAKSAPPEVLDEKRTALETTATAGFGAAGPAANYAYARKGTLKPELASGFSLRIAGGELQRSSDGGATWQAGLHPNRPLICFGQRPSEAWAGGEAGILYRSTDGGLTWAAVQPAVDAQPLTADVVSIKFGVGTVILSTRDNETWTTADSGQTWEKK